MGQTKGKGEQLVGKGGGLGGAMGAAVPSGGPLGIGRSIVSSSPFQAAFGVGDRATYGGDQPFTRETKEVESNLEDRPESRRTSQTEIKQKKVEDADDYSMDRVRERLLNKAKEERQAKQEQDFVNKQIYDQSLPKPKEKAAELFLGENTQEDVKRKIGNMPRPLQMMVGGV